MRRILCVGFYVICMLFIFTTRSETTRYNVGTYTSVQKGLGGDMTVEVEFDSNSILPVAVTEHNKTDSFGDRAIEVLPGDILEVQSVEVDSVTSATITSEAIKETVVDYIQQAEKQILNLTAKYYEPTSGTIIIGTNSLTKCSGTGTGTAFYGGLGCVPFR